MKTITTILRDVHNELKLGFRSDFITGTVQENNINEESIEMLVALVKPITANPSYENGGRKFTYPSINMLFVMLDELEATDKQHEDIIAKCLAVYNQFIFRLKKVEYITVTEGKIVQVYNDQDANLTGLSATFQIVQNVTDSLCLL